MKIFKNILITKIVKFFMIVTKVLTLNIFFFFLFQNSYGNFEKHFPLLNMIVNTPFFQREKEKFSTNEEVYFFLQNLSKKSSNVDYREMTLSTGGKIPYVILSENGERDSEKNSVWILAMQHGDEHGSGEAALGLAEFLSLNNDKILESMNIFIFPRLNLYGAEKNNALLYGNIDMNTDHALLFSPEAQALKKELILHTPEIIIDLHEYPASEKSFSKLPSKTILPYYDILLSIPTNINISDTMKSKQRADIEEIKEELERKGVTVGSYYSSIQEKNGNLTLLAPSSSIKIARNNFALIPTFTFLIEGRGKDLGLNFFQRRVGSLEETTITFLKNFKNSSKDRKKYIYDERQGIIENRKNIMFSSDRNEVYQDSYRFINMKTNEVEQFNVKVVTDFSKIGAITKRIPKGYLLDYKNQKIISKLNKHGIKYSTLAKEENILVESFKREEDKKNYSLIKIEKLFPSETIYISSNQIQKLLIALLFEPESESSFVNLGLIPSKDLTLPYYRVIAE